MGNTVMVPQAPPQHNKDTIKQDQNPEKQMFVPEPELAPERSVGNQQQRCNTSTARSSGSSKTVGFSDVHVHEHRLSMGDHPCVSSGVPVQLGWDIEKSETFDLDTYEGKRRGFLTRLTSSTRNQIAAARHTRASIVRVEEEVQEIKASRRINRRRKKKRNAESDTGRQKKAARANHSFW